MLGLDSAGKTTVLYRLKFNEFVNTVPTIGFNTEKIKLSNGTAKGISCHFWDVGGQEKLRPLWKSYSRCTDGIIYVVDSVDVDRLEEAKTELHKVTKFAENQGTPLLVIANKQDLPKSLPVADIERQLALNELTPSTTYHIQPACAIIGEGLHEGMDKFFGEDFDKCLGLPHTLFRVGTAPTELRMIFSCCSRLLGPRELLSDGNGAVPAHCTQCSACDRKDKDSVRQENLMDVPYAFLTLVKLVMVPFSFWL
ncbi:hypothetical protein P4O66_000803 [Electrophorus voltai]|uniref:ADP-ribosylation factor-like 4Cb n=1 Tax=Electrophorus voltai TaxID=2609070 RepID=A0AAD8ZED9_9TELE|nr:hypothetical protein P4O66_000803 [Electrophorus voltai]